MLRQPVTDVYQVAPGAVTATGAEAFILNTKDVNSLVAKLNVSAASGTSPTLDVYIQTSFDGGTTWYDAAHFAQETATTAHPLFLTLPINAGDGKYVGDVHANSIAAGTVSGLPLMGPNINVAYTIAGTTPDFTFTVDFYAQNQSTGAGA